MATDTAAHADSLNDLLKGFRSAAQAYDKALDAIEDDNAMGRAALVTIKDDHHQAVSRLTSRVTELGGTPATDTGAWGTFATAAQSVANVLGDRSALESLKQGEEHGLNDCKSLLEEGLDPQTKQMISHELIPMQQAHIESLEGLAKSQ